MLRKWASLELFKEIEIHVNFAVDLNSFANRFSEKRLNIRDPILRVGGDGHVALDGFSIRVLGFDAGHHFGFIKSQVGGQIDRDFEFRQNIFSHLEMFGETLARYHSGDVPVAQDGLIR